MRDESIVAQRFNEGSLTHGLKYPGLFDLQDFWKHRFPLSQLS